MDDHSHLSDTELRVRALESLLTDKGLVDPVAMDAIVAVSYTHLTLPTNREV